QRYLDFNGFLRRKEMFGAVEMRTEGDPFTGHPAQTGVAEYLVAARIGEDGMRPGHEAMQAAHFADELVPGTQIEMIRVGEKDLNAEVFERLLTEPLDGGGGAHRHKSRRFDDAVGRLQAPQPRPTRVGLQDFK